MATVRENQAGMNAAQWQQFIQAVNTLLHGVNAAQPAYHDFVKVHVEAMSMVGMSCGVTRQHASEPFWIVERDDAGRGRLCIAQGVCP